MSVCDKCTIVPHQAQNGAVAQKQQEQQMQQSKRESTPHLLNLHEDPMMSLVLAFFFERPDTRICRAEAPTPPGPTDIVLSGILIEPDHAVVAKDAGGRCTLVPATNTARTFVNGNLVARGSPVVLQHFDRVQLGVSMCFLFVDPATRGNRRDPLAEGLDWR